ncbi:uncharacterized protein LOC117581921 isoform X1 [Drosophila guanche]|uniref:MADF domain-containing protein n=1 Tax=Drosophila guanche TaxID=7266 RepID=A0A3B0J2F2_DROGU|nr:uncharacterized protein LOC117581921 isoform X1 [Drosophila guanche]SPP73193.1 Hypothetical predicted protein [Drosophila guanche]
MSANTEDVGDPPPTKRRVRRRPTIWTREKISKLIQLYRKSDCLWNHYSELYKNKDCRSRTIEHICSSLGITKNEYGKKIHNLRNQFNSELKKLERRQEETGADKTCRWEHFKSLMFLRPIIEPRPGYQPNGPTQCKKLSAKLEGDQEEDPSSVPKCQLEIAEKRVTVADESMAPQIQSICEKIEPSVPEYVSAILSASTTCTSSAATRQVDAAGAVSVPAQVSIGRDQWDSFGELIANEFRNLNSDISRKRLKRRIMQVMLEVGEEDDREQAGPNS